MQQQCEPPGPGRLEDECNDRECVCLYVCVCVTACSQWSSFSLDLKKGKQ